MVTGLPGGSAPLRLLLVLDSLDVGGAERHVVDLALALQQRGHHVAVASSTGGTLAEALERANVPVHLLMDQLVKRRVSMSFARKVRKVVCAGEFALVHAHLYASASAAALATCGLGVPLVVTEHSEGLWRTHRARRMSRWTYRRARAVLAVSHPIRERLIEEDDVPPERVQFLSNAARLPSDLGPPALPPGVRGCPLVGVIARLQREKGLSIFLEAAGRVASTFPRARFLLVGDGPLRHELLCQARRLGLEGRVHFLGFRTDALGVLASLDLCVVPSLSEGAPLVVLEAMTLGVPVVATAVGGIPHQLRHNREGLLVPPGDATGLAEACIALLQNPERAQTLAEAGRVRARSQFRHEALVQHIEDLYCALLGEPLLVSSMKEPTPGTM